MAEANILKGFLGGMIIGSAASLLLLLNGRIAGISGIVGGLISRNFSRDWCWRFVFVLGLVVGAGLYSFLSGSLAVELQATTPALIVAGLLVGIGTRLGSGCTSGHGVCGLARRSLRSVVATATFMVSGAVTVYVMRHLLS